MSATHEPSPADWSELEPLLDQAMELEAAQREAWLAHLGQTRPDAARELRALLVRLDAIHADNFLEQPLFSEAVPVAPALRAILERQTPPTGQTGASITNSTPELGDGARVGPYMLLRQIGRGGTSSVWLAERSDGQLKRQVALKLPFIGSQLRTEHFLRERDMLAALTHPNIARLYDAGVSDTGQPYLAMEYVEGTALLGSCDERRLTIRERLRVFLQVLEAVQFAHAALIIHRDLKPSNILLTAQTRAVLLDFGIGKLLTDIAQPTRLGRALTLDYASPEQITGQPLGVASDIYSLGVILYELLTGLRPYQPKRDSAAAVEDAILTGEVQRPSQRELAPAATSARGTSERTLRRALAGDLDNVVLKALQKNPAHRYASIGALAQDIGNHLNCVPVSARADSFWYRAERFIRRHKVPASAASFAALALLWGSGLALWQARVADSERDVAVALADRNAAVVDFLGRIIKDASESPRPITVSEMLTRAEGFALHDVTELPENRASILEIVADRYWNLGQVKRAGALMKRAVELLEGSADRGLRARYRCKLAMMTANTETGERAMQTMAAELAAAGTDSEAAATCLLCLTISASNMGRGEDTARYAQRGLEVLAGSSRPSGVLQAQLLTELAFATHLNGNSFEAQQRFEQALQLLTAMGRERSEDAVKTMNGAASILVRITPRRSLELLEEVERIERMREPDAPTDAAIESNKAMALQLLGRYVVAEAAHASVCRRSQVGTRHCTHGLATVMLETNRLAGAEQLLQDVAQSFRPNEPLDIIPRMVNAVLTGKLHLLESRLPEARMQFAKALQHASAAQLVLAQLGMAETELRSGNPAVARDFAQQALDASRQAHRGFSHSHQIGVCSLMLGRVLLQSGEMSEARAAIQAAVEHLSNTVDANHPQLLSARQLLASMSA